MVEWAGALLWTLNPEAMIRAQVDLIGHSPRERRRYSVSMYTAKVASQCSPA